VTAVAFSPDGTQLATTSHDHTARIWDLATAQTRTTLTGHTGPVTAVAFSPDGTLLATASRDGTARIWDVRRHSLRARGGPIPPLILSMAVGRWGWLESRSCPPSLWAPSI
jgi:WD40 repeat protein